LVVGVVVFWIARLVIQPLVFDRVMRTGRLTRSPVIRFGASVLWMFYVAVYAAALATQVRNGDAEQPGLVVR
jgi:hypothetical protein